MNRLKALHYARRLGIIDAHFDDWVPELMEGFLYMWGDSYNDNSLTILEELSDLRALRIQSTSMRSPIDFSRISGLKELDLCECLALTESPICPEGLSSLRLSHTGVKVIYNLPRSLRKLVAVCTSLEQWPELPDSLIYLDLAFNRISHVGLLPAGLELLDIHGTYIKELPKLPDSLKTICCPDDLRIPSGWSISGFGSCDETDYMTRKKTPNSMNLVRVT